MSSNVAPIPPQEVQAPDIPSGQPQPHQPQQILAQSLSISQTAPYVPAHVWTPQILLDYHQKLYDIGIDNNRLLEAFRKREYWQGWAGIVLVAGIISFGGYLVIRGNPLGKDIIVASVAFLGGYLAGKGRSNLK